MHGAYAMAPYAMHGMPITYAPAGHLAAVPHHHMGPPLPHPAMYGAGPHPQALAFAPFPVSMSMANMGMAGVSYAPYSGHGAHYSQDGVTAAPYPVYGTYPGMAIQYGYSAAAGATLAADGAYAVYHEQTVSPGSSTRGGRHPASNRYPCALTAPYSNFHRGSSSRGRYSITHSYSHSGGGRVGGPSYSPVPTGQSGGSMESLAGSGGDGQPSPKR